MEKLKDLDVPKSLKFLLGSVVTLQTILHYLGVIGIILGIVALIFKNTQRGIELLIGGAGFIVLKYLIGFIFMGVMLLYNRHLNKKERKETIIYRDINKQQKTKGKERILKELQKKDKITNNDVEKLLNVADSTATNYLQELENEGKIKQIGETGSGVYYILNG